MDKPKIRFQGFEEDWCEKTLGEIAEFFDYGLNVSAKKYDGTNKYLRITDIDEISRLFVLDNIASPNTDIRKVANYKLSDQDIVFARTGASVGKTYIYNKIDGNVYFAGFLIRARIPLKYSAQFIFQKTLTEDYKKFVVSTSQRSGQPGINANEYSTYKCFIPSSLSEQEKIGKLFERIDHLLNLQQRKCEKLKVIKKAMLSKMFPKPGKKVPEVRFQGFTDDWVECKISDLFKITRGNVLAESKTNSKSSKQNPYPVYSSQTKENGLLGYYSKYLYEDAITWTTDGANAGTVKFRMGKFYCTNVCGVLLTKTVEANPMIAEALNMVAKGHVSYVGNPKLMNNVMADISLKIPLSQKERTINSNFFHKLDSLIRLSESKLSKLRLIKGSLLEGMFV